MTALHDPSFMDAYAEFEIKAARDEQRRFIWPNGHGASVIWHAYAYGAEDGQYEIAVTDKDGHLDYTTPLTSDVLGRLSEADVIETLDAIAALPQYEAAS